MQKQWLLLAILIFNSHARCALKSYQPPKVESPRLSLNTCMEILGLSQGTTLDAESVTNAYKNQLKELDSITIPIYVDILINSLKQDKNNGENGLDEIIQSINDIHKKLKNKKTLTKDESILITHLYQSHRTSQLKELKDAYYGLQRCLNLINSH
jgi:hypothetical protein